MQRYGLILKLRPDKKEEYIKLHKDVWPEVLSAIKEANISNNTAFIGGDLLIMYLEYSGTDFISDWKKYGENEYVKKWFEKMGTLLLPFENPMPPTAWTIMEEVFHLD